MKKTAAEKELAFQRKLAAHLAKNPANADLLARAKARLAEIEGKPS